MLVANGAQPGDPLLEIGIAIPARRSGEFRQLTFRNVEPTPHRRQHVVAAPLHDAAGHPLHGHQRLTSRGCLTSGGQERLVRRHPERRAVELARDPIAPRDQLAEQRQLAAREIARALEAEEGVFLAIAVAPLRPLQPAELFLRPRPASGPVQLLLQPIAQIEQIHRVLGRVAQHVGRERTHRPVGALMLLVELHAEVALEEGRQAEAPNPEDLRRHSRVEEVRRMPAVVLMQEPQVVVGIVKDDLDARRLEQPAERRRLADGQRIEHGAPLARGELEQVDAVDETMKARAFGIDGDRLHPFDSAKEALGFLRGLDVQRLMLGGTRRGAHSTPRLKQHLILSRWLGRL